MQNFDWYVARLDLASWESETPGARSGFFACPVHGGSDSLHVTEKNGKALLKCFACEATALDITASLEEIIDVQEAPAPLTARAVSTGSDAGTTAVKRRISRGVRGQDSTVVTPNVRPLAWMAERCAMTRDELVALNLPLSETDDAVVFEFANAQKLRLVGEGKKGKDFRWRGSDIPPLWPTPETPGTEIVICEGEADAICLRASGIEAYSVTKGAQSGIPAVVWDTLRALDVETVHLVYDMDDAGRKGRDAAAAGARLAGLKVREARVGGIDPLAGETDARSVALRTGYPLELEDDADEDQAQPLSSVSSVPPAPPILGRLHPTEHTILFGDGGTGKGVIASWWIAQMTRELGMRVLILDYEQHAQFEWRPRVEAFGGNLDEVFIVQPVRPIWDIAAWVAGQAELHGADYLVVDSVAYACVGQEVEKSVTATRYSLAVATIARPTLSLAHVPKSTDDPNHPFGSTFWSNGARVTISVSRQTPDDPFSPRVVRNAKTNQHAPFKTRAIDWSWLANDRPGITVKGGHYNTLLEKEAYSSAADAVRASRALRGRDVTADEVFEDTGMQVSDASVRTTQHRVRQIVARQASRDQDATRDVADGDARDSGRARSKRASDSPKEDASD